MLYPELLLTRRLESCVSTKGLRWLFMYRGLGQEGSHRHLERENFSEPPGCTPSAWAEGLFPK